MEDSYKRENSATGEPFLAGYQDETGRIFLRYLNKQGNDGYYLEEWKKDINSFTRVLFPDPLLPTMPINSPG